MGKVFSNTILMFSAISIFALCAISVKTFAQDEDNSEHERNSSNEILNREAQPAPQEDLGRTPQADDREFVFIEGKYYKSRSDNTYFVNGRRIFFVDNRKRNNVKKSSSSNREGR